LHLRLPSYAQKISIVFSNDESQARSEILALAVLTMRVNSGMMISGEKVAIFMY